MRKKKEKDIEFILDTEGLTVQYNSKNILSLSFLSIISFIINYASNKSNKELILSSGNGFLSIQTLQNLLIQIDLDQLIKFAITKTDTKIDDKIYNLIGSGFIKKINFQIPIVKK